MIAKAINSLKVHVENSQNSIREVGMLMTGPLNQGRIASQDEAVTYNSHILMSKYTGIYYFICQNNRA